MRTLLIVLCSAFVLATPAGAGMSDNMGGMNMGNENRSEKAKGPPDFVNTWHGLGPDHQKDQQPGDTAADRHNFLDAAAGNSGKSPTANASIY